MSIQAFVMPMEVSKIHICKKTLVSALLLDRLTLFLISYKAADGWFESLRISSQALLEPHRKDRMRRVKIAILDTGISRAHAEIESQWNKRIKGVKSWIDGEDGDQDCCGHGTHGAALLICLRGSALPCWPSLRPMQSSFQDWE